MSKLNHRDYEILDFIKSYISRYGYAPSYEEIGEGVELYSKASVCRHVKRLLFHGELETDHPGSPRAIRIKRDIENCQEAAGV